ncbi:hypothetical protein C9374_009376 [Naegleria lovaniensis]|uniref:Glycoside hydrolase family 38 central domain-containing protein n=1 Tax=Naegleria lovaniensis TaxID=51637 RepID=A0AA88GIK9_NAELO|nr:uncharacterized protein C9374_009376 [Naegleria lovaniensis]KAG2377465.1 hypothetical protein C9374_009376 [Naegleria lovaniensis]
MAAERVFGVRFCGARCLYGILMMMIALFSMMIMITTNSQSVHAQQAFSSSDPNNIYFKTVHMIPHSHWDVGWLKTKKAYYEEDVKPIIEGVLEALDKNPKRKFIFVEMSFINYWWDEAQPHKRNLFVKFLKEKRIEFALGGMTMSDEAANTYTSVIHTLTRGHQFVMDTFDSQIDSQTVSGINTFVPHTSFRIDPFGSTTTMTRLYAESGLNDTVIMRIPQKIQTEMRNSKRMSFTWKLSDGSTVYSNVMDYQYCVRPLFFNEEQGSIAYVDEDEAAEILHQQIMKYSLGFKQSDIMIPAGCDFTFKYAKSRFELIEKAIRGIEKNSTKYPYKIKYSLLSEYMEASKPQTDSQNIVDYDFMPYADGPSAFWTGYYTSYPVLKQSIRVAESFFRTAKTLFAISVPFVKEEEKTAFISEGFRNLDVLAVAMADVTHHDAITGTSKFDVTTDYIQSLSNGVTAAKKTLFRALSTLLTSRISKGDMLLEHYNTLLSQTFSFKSFLDALGKLVTQRIKDYSIPIAIYNSLGWDIYHHVAVINVDDEVVDVASKICFYDNRGTPLKSQIIRSVLDQNDQDLYLVIPHVPALGYTLVFAKPCKDVVDNDMQETTVNVADKNGYTVTNGKTSLTFCQHTQIGGVTLCSVEKSGKKYDLSQQLMYYESDSSSPYSQHSGAYIFVPKAQSPKPMITSSTSKALTITKKASRGIFTQVSQIIADNVKQYVRIYDPKVSQQGFDFEYIYVVGPLGMDQEIITRFDASAFINSGETFYCDKNGLETVKVSRKDKVEATYMPIVYNCYIRDETKNRQLTLFVTETHGAASVKNGQLEIMLHRRTYSDDGRGVDQPVNDDSVVALNIKVRIDEGLSAPDLRGIAFPKETLVNNYPPFLAPFEKDFYTPLSYYNDDGEAVINVEHASKLVEQFSALHKSLDDNIHLTNLDIVLNRKSLDTHDAKALVQLQHLGPSSELDRKSLSIRTMFIKELVNKKDLTLDETNLSTSKKISQKTVSDSFFMEPFTFKTFLFKQGKSTPNYDFKEQDQALEWTFSVSLLLASVVALVFLSLLGIYFVYRQARDSYTIIEQDKRPYIMA